jgi:hypothetical protein
MAVANALAGIFLMFRLIRDEPANSQPVEHR